jgi:hypothetical protein
MMRAGYALVRPMVVGGLAAFWILVLAQLTRAL